MVDCCEWCCWEYGCAALYEMCEGMPVQGARCALLAVRCALLCCTHPPSSKQVHAQNITGWRIYSEASSSVATPHEPSHPTDTVRIELAAVLGPSITASDFAFAIRCVFSSLCARMCPMPLTTYTLPSQRQIYRIDARSETNTEFKRKVG